jgi:hypothetical protein
MERIGEGTWFAIDRKIFSSDLWFASPWKLKIFLYLLGNANHEPGTFMGIEINRGELIRSFRTIQNDCAYKIGYRLKKPSFDTVRRVCEDLTKELRIVQRSVHCGTLFKILNYNELQPNIKQRSDQRKRESSFNGAEVTVQNNNVKNVNNEKETNRAANRRHKIPPDFSLTEHLLQIANNYGLNGDRVHTVFEHFKAHHESRGSTMLNWDKAWVTWVIKDKSFAKNTKYGKEDAPTLWDDKK